MRRERSFPSSDARQHERLMVAAAREQAARARARGVERCSNDAPTAGSEDRIAELQTHLAGYEVVREIHRGGQGVVYLAIQRSTRRQVAIKVMKEGPFAGADDKARFDREVRILAHLDHPSIVAIHDSGIAGGCFYFVMNYVAGLSLDAYVRDREPTLDAVLRMFATIAEAVNAAHLRGIVHRDLKPSNIRIDADGLPHVLDFGLAKVEEGAAAPGGSIIPAMTMTGQFVGSLPWASPEQAAGIAGGIDVRSDVYSLGVVLYQILTGTFPYDIRGAMFEVVGRIAHTEPVRPSNASGGGRGRFRIDGEVETIVLKCLSKDPDRRYQNAGELARDIRRYLGGEPIEARRDSVVYMLSKTLQRHRLGFAFACTVLVLLFAGLGVSLALWRQAAAARGGLEEALERADRREKDIRQVADAQAKMLGSVDPQVMGTRLREDVLAEARAALERSGVDVVEVAVRMEQLETLLLGTNFTNAGVRSIDRNVLAPALTSVEIDFAEQPLVQAALWRSIAKVYGRLGLYDAAVPPAKRAYETCRRELGDDHPDTSEAIQTVCQMFAFGRRDALADAEPYLQEVLEDRREALARSRRERGDEAPETRALIGEFALNLWALRRYADAEPYFREGLEVSRRMLGNDHSDTVEAVGGMGTLLFYMGKPSDAEPYYRESMEGRRRIYGPDHPTAVIGVFQMGYTLRAAGRLPEAESYLREAVAGSRRVSGNDNPETLNMIRNLASTLEDQGKFAEAEQYFREVLAGNQRIKGDDHEHTIMAMSVVAQVLIHQEKDAEAESYCRRAIADSRRVLGNDSSSEIINQSLLGRSLCGLGRLDEADKLGEEAVKRARGLPGVETTFLGLSLMHHGQTLTAMERFEEAEKELVEAHQVLAARLPMQARTRDALESLAALYEAWHAAEPDQGHDVPAAEWRRKFKERADAMAQPARSREDLK